MGMGGVHVGGRGQNVRRTLAPVIVEGDRRQNRRRRKERREEKLEPMTDAEAHVETIAELF